MARPTTYRVSHCVVAKKIAQLGGIDKDVAQALEVTEQTINNWKLKHPEFFEALKLGKDEVDERVKQSLVHRALGYSHPEDDIRAVNGQIVVTPTTKHYPPDTTACIFWLKNRKSEEFRQNPEPGNTEEPIAPSTITIEVRDARLPEPPAS
jgi:hypothetical protein